MKYELYLALRSMTDLREVDLSLKVQGRLIRKVIGSNNLQCIFHLQKLERIDFMTFTSLTLQMLEVQKKDQASQLEFIRNLIKYCRFTKKFYCFALDK